MDNDVVTLVKVFNDYLEANDISPNSKTAIKLQHAFVLGANTVAELAMRQLNPALLCCMMAGRPIATLNQTIKGKVGEERTA
jgi:hypothetical protein